MSDFVANAADDTAPRSWAALDGLPDYLTIIDSGGLVCYTNPAWQQLLAERLGRAEAFGVGSDYIAGYEALFDLEHDDAHALSTGLRAVLAGASDRFDLNYPYQAGGERQWFSITVVPYMVAGARGALIQQRDISVRKRAEAALRQSEELFRQIAENIGEVFWMTDPQKNQMLYISPAYEQIWGRTRESLYAHPASFIEAIHPEDRPRVLAALERQAHGTYNEEYRVVQPNGPIRWVQDRAFPIRDATGGIYRIAGIAADITERRQAEAALRQSIQQEEIIRAQAVALAELSTPLIPITEDVMVMPLVGSVDSRRAQQVIETLLSGIAESKARVAILDITGVSVVDTQVADALIRAAQAVRLLGAQVMLTGIRPEIAQTLVGLGADLSSIVTHGTLRSGIASVIRGI
jgi:PAS domain S-box-containing protein